MRKGNKGQGLILVALAGLLLLGGLSAWLLLSGKPEAPAVQRPVSSSEARMLR